MSIVIVAAVFSMNSLRNYFSGLFLIFFFLYLNFNGQFKNTGKSFFFHPSGLILWLKEKKKIEPTTNKPPLETARCKIWINSLNERTLIGSTFPKACVPTSPAADLWRLVQAGFKSTCHNWEAFWKREPQLRKCPHLFVFWPSLWYIFMIEVLTHCCQCCRLWVGGPGSY